MAGLTSAPEDQVDDEERLRRFHQHRDRYGKRRGAQSGNRWQEARWTGAHPETREPDK